MVKIGTKNSVNFTKTHFAVYITDWVMYTDRLSVWAKALSLLFRLDYFMREIKGRKRHDQHVSQNLNWGLFLLLQPIIRLYLSWNVVILHYTWLLLQSIFPRGTRSKDISSTTGLQNACGVISIVYDAPCQSRKQTNLHYCIEINTISSQSLKVFNIQREEKI